jgi:hypothetical protein
MESKRGREDYENQNELQNLKKVLSICYDSFFISIQAHERTKHRKYRTLCFNIYSES